MEEDFPLFIEEARRELQPIATTINTFGYNKKYNYKYKASLFENQLIVNGISYTTDTLDKLPTDISTEKLFTQRNNNMVAFFSKHSPLSNYHSCNIEVEGNNYNCQEQHYTQQKALAFNDFKTAEKIMKETKPANMKRLGKNINNYDNKIWREKKETVMKRGLTAKFRDQKLQSFLLGTGSATLMEASPYDQFWGVGLSMYNARIWKKNNW